MWWPFHRDHSPLRDLIEARAANARTRAQEVDVAKALERRRRVIRENHFGPQIAEALRLPDKDDDAGGQP
jgi:hypothetical protein